MGKTINELLHKLYYQLKSPASYSGIQALLREARKHNRKITQKDVQNFLQNELNWTLYKPARRKYPRLKTIPSGLHTDWQCDLCIFDELKDDNQQFRYLLVCIDVLSRKIFVAPAKSKKSEHMIQSFDKIFEKSNVIPNKIYSDSGVEFQANKMLDYFKNNDIIKHVMYSPNLHAGVVERANKTIKLRLYKYFNKNNTRNWIDIIDKIVAAINNSKNRTIGMTPNSVTFKNAQQLRERLYKEDGPTQKAKFEKGNIIRISREKGKFGRSFHPNFTDELFEIAQVKNTNPPSYRIKDLEGNDIKGIFYDPELVLTNKETAHRVAEILKTRTRKGQKEHFVRWIGYSDQHNSWIKDSDLVK